MSNKQSIFGRISQLVRANINSLIDNAEDPQLMIDQLIRDFTSNIKEAESAIAQTIGQLRMLEDDYREDVQAASEWGNKALAATLEELSNGQADLLKRMSETHDHSQQLRPLVPGGDGTVLTQY